MKTKSIIVVVASILTMCVTSCKRATFLKVDNDSIRTTIKGTEGDIIIETDGGSVEVEHAPQWVKTTLNETNDTLHYVVEMNTDRQLREDSIVLKCSPLSCRIDVRQSFTATHIKFTPAEVVLPVGGGTVEVSVDADGEGALVVDNTDIARVEGRKVIITMEKNWDTYDKMVTVTVGCDAITAPLQVSQKNGKCPACNGTGHSNRTCPICHGEGWHVCCNYSGKAFCDQCNGSGVVE